MPFNAVSRYVANCGMPLRPNWADVAQPHDTDDRLSDLVRSDLVFLDDLLSGAVADVQRHDPDGWHGGKGVVSFRRVQQGGRCLVPIGIMQTCINPTTIPPSRACRALVHGMSFPCAAGPVFLLGRMGR